MACQEQVQLEQVDVLAEDRVPLDEVILTIGAHLVRRGEQLEHRDDLAVLQATDLDVGRADLLHQNQRHGHGLHRGDAAVGRPWRGPGRVLQDGDIGDNQLRATGLLVDDRDALPDPGLIDYRARSR